MKLLDIKDFQPYSSVSDTDRILMVKGATDTDASITIGLLMNLIANKLLLPTIKDGVWYIGDKSTGISAVGKSPIIKDQIWWIWDESKNDYVSTGQTVNSTFVLTKEAIEGLLTGNVISHEHSEYTVPTLTETPTESTLTWTDDDNNLYMFYVGQLCRVADESSENGYKFYQLYNILDGKAVWGEISGKRGVGQTYPNTINGEIFNDYENNIATGIYSHSEGSGGGKSYTVSVSEISGAFAYYYNFPLTFNPKKGDVHVINGKSYEILDASYDEWSIVIDDTQEEGIVVRYKEEPEFSIGTIQIQELRGLALGKSSHKEGHLSNASDNYTHAEGHNTQATGEAAHSEGRDTFANGPRSHAEGYSTSVYAANAHAEGRETWAIGSQAHVEGLYCIAIGSCSHVEGSVQADFFVGEESSEILNDVGNIRRFLDNFTDAYYPSEDRTYYYHKLKDEFIKKYKINAALGDSCHVEGVNNIVCDRAGHVEGYNNLVGDLIPSMGKDNVAYAPHVEGIQNKVASLLRGVHLGGVNSSIESGDYTFGHGHFLLLKNDFETAFGRYNASEVDGKKVLFAYGIGTSDTNRKNAISVFEDGTVSIPGLIGVSVDEQIKPLNDKIEEQSKIISNLESCVNDLSHIIAKLHPELKVFVVGDRLIATSLLDAEVSESTMTISDSNTSVTDDVLVFGEYVPEPEQKAYVEEDTLYFTESASVSITGDTLIIADSGMYVDSECLTI